MANKLTVELEIDPSGRGAAAIRGIKSNLEDLGKSSEKSFSSAASGGRDLASAFNEIKSAIAVGLVVEYGRQAVKSFAEAGDAARVLKASTKEAGLGYDELNQKAVKFGELVGQSESEAKRSFASIVQFAKQAGKSGELDQFTTRLTDLAAARGINADKLPDLLSQLKTGQDEVFDRLFGANPSKFYDEYARSVGRTAESLSDAEKAQVRFDAIVKGGAIFSGEAAARAGDLSGSIDKLAANFENLKKNIGQAVNAPASSVLGLLNAGISGKEDAAFTRLLDTLGLVDASDSKGLNQIKAEAEKRAAALVATFREQEKKIIDALANPNGTLENSALASIDLTNLKLELGPAKREEIINRAKEEAGRMRDNLKKALEDTAQDERSSVSLLRLAIKELNTRGGVLGDDQSKIRKQLEDAIERQVKPALDKIKELGKSSKSLLDDVVGSANRDNPFVKLFSDAEKAAERLKEATRGLSKEVVAEFQKIQNQAGLAQLFDARLGNRLGALDLRMQAEEFRKASAPQLDSRTAAANNIDFLTIARRDPNRYREFLNERGDFVDESAREQMRLRFTLSALAEDNPRANLAITGAALLRNFRGETSVDPNLSVQERLKRQLATIDDEFKKNTDLSETERLRLADRRAISLTSSLRPEELTTDLRDRAAAAREREAVRLDNQEKEARTRQAEQNDLLKQVNKNLEDLKKIATEQGLSGLNVILENNTDFDIRPQLERAPGQ